MEGFVSRFEKIKLAEDALDQEKERLLADFVGEYDVVWLTIWKDTTTDDYIFGHFLSKAEALLRNENIKPIDTKEIKWPEFQSLNRNFFVQ